METAPKVSNLQEPSEEGAEPGGSLAADIKREVIDEIRAERKSRRVVRLGDRLPSLAFLFIIVSAAIKIAYAGRVKPKRRPPRRRKWPKRRASSARCGGGMAAMQAQVEPHFLFNTLASIDHLIEVDPPRASRMQKNLIACCAPRCPRCARVPATRDGAAGGAPLPRDPEGAHGDRLQAEISVAEGLYSADFPPMMLQSLVENAISTAWSRSPKAAR